MSDLRDLTDQMRAFSEERDWVKFHDPKSLLLALVGEVGELSELMQWLPVPGSARRRPKNLFELGWLKNWGMSSSTWLALPTCAGLTSQQQR